MIIKTKTHKVHVYQCDICNETSEYGHAYWANNFNGGKCNIVDDGINGMDVHQWKHLCRNCRGTIYSAIAEAVKKREKFKNKEQKWE